MTRLGGAVVRDRAEERGESDLCALHRLAEALGARSEAAGQALFDRATAAADEIAATHWAAITAVALALCESPTGRLTGTQVAALMHREGHDPL